METACRWPEMPDLRLEDVSKQYGRQDVSALTNINLTLRQGELVTLAGPSGSGKSTLLHLMAAFDRPTSGTVRVDGSDLAALRPKALADLRGSTFAFVFQRFHLMTSRSALANVEMGLLYRGVTARVRRREAADALDRVGLTNRASVLARNLSGGEAQRVAIARATVGRAPILLADEPTGNLDQASGSAVVSLLQAYAESGATVVIVTHDAAVAAVGRRQLRLHDGRVASDTASESI